MISIDLYRHRQSFQFGVDDASLSGFVVHLLQWVIENDTADSHCASPLLNHHPSSNLDCVVLLEVPGPSGRRSVNEDRPLFVPAPPITRCDLLYT